MVTPDGPKGPAQVAKMGVIQLARASGLPIVPLAFGCSKKNTLRAGIASWFRILARAVCISGGPHLGSARAAESGLEANRLELETTLNRMTAEVG